MEFGDRPPLMPMIVMPDDLLLSMKMCLV
jgi:hypothetical protein